MPPSKRAGRSSSEVEPRRWRWFLCGLFLLSLAWRAGVLLRLGRTPLVEYLNADSAIYWDWSTEIRAGHWLPAQPFFLGPLYPYALAVVRSLLGDRIGAVLAAQVVLGSASVVVLTDAVRRLTSARAAGIVGIVLAGYSMSVFFDVQVLSESLLFFLGSAALWFTVRSGRMAAASVGGLTALMALGRPVFVLLLVPYGLALIHRSPSRLRTAAMLMALPALVAVLTAFHHARSAGAPIPFTYSGGYNLYVGNGPFANGTYVPFIDESDPASARGAGSGVSADGRYYLEHTAGLRLDAAESDRYWSSAAWAWMREHPRREARLLLLKLGLLFNRDELPQIVGATTYERAAGSLGWPIRWEFVTLLAGGLLGAFLGRRHWPARMLTGCVAALAVGTSMFFVVDRYRLHLVPYLAVLAGIALTGTAPAFARRGVMAVSLAVVVAACAIALQPLVPHDPARDGWDYATTLGQAWLSQDDPGRAAEWLERATALDERGLLRGSDTPSARLMRAGVYDDLATAHFRLGRNREAQTSARRAVELAPQARGLNARYATVLAINGKADSARAFLAAAGTSRARLAQDLLGEAARREARGDVPGTRNYLHAAADMNPALEAAVVGSIRLEIMADSLETAAARIDRAEAHGLDAHVANAHRAWIRLAAGDRAGSRRLLQAIPEDRRSGDPRVAGTIELMSR